MVTKYKEWLSDIQKLFLNQTEFSEEIFDWLEEAAEYRYLLEQNNKN